MRKGISLYLLAPEEFEEFSGLACGTEPASRELASVGDLVGNRNRINRHKPKIKCDRKQMRKGEEEGWVHIAWGF